MGVAVCPGAPFLIEGTADAIARTVPDLGAACRAALARLPVADRMLLIGTGAAADEFGAAAGQTGAALATTAAWRMFPPGTVVRTSVTRGDTGAERTVILPGEPAREDPMASPEQRGVPVSLPSVATLVGTNLLRWAPTVPPTTAVEVTRIAGAGAGEIFADLTRELTLEGSDRVALLVIADGAACHGANAPGRLDDRSGAFDEALADALAAGNPVALRTACQNPDLPAEALLSSVAPLRLLADLTFARAPDEAELLYSGAPFGVGYFVASWRWVGA